MAPGAPLGQPYPLDPGAPPAACMAARGLAVGGISPTVPTTDFCGTWTWRAGRLPCSSTLHTLYFFLAAPSTFHLPPSPLAYPAAEGGDASPPPPHALCTTRPAACEAAARTGRGTWPADNAIHLQPLALPFPGALIQSTRGVCAAVADALRAASHHEGEAPLPVPQRPFPRRTACPRPATRLAKRGGRGCPHSVPHSVHRPPHPHHPRATAGCPSHLHLRLPLSPRSAAPHKATLATTPAAPHSAASTA